MPYDSKSDIWSLGCVLYEMCALVPPFRADDMQGLYKKVIKGKYPRIPEHFSQEMATVIKFMLQVSPSYRPTCDQILSLPIIESLIKKFFPEETQSQNLPETHNGDNEIMLKTIRLSKNIFSLTERLPKSQYRSPKVYGSNVSGDQSNSLLPQLTNVKTRNNNMSTIQPPNGKSASKPKSRLQDYHNNPQPQDQNNASGGYEEEEFDSGDGSSPPHLKINKNAKNQRSQKAKLQNANSDFEGTGDQPQIMRIASQGGPINYSDRENHKRTRSDNPIEINSIEGDRSLDPDHEPRKEGTVK